MAKLGPLKDVPRTVKIRLIGQTYGLPWVNIFHAQWAAGGTVPDSAGLLTMCIALRTAWTTNFKPLAITNSGLSMVECTDISSRTGQQANDPTVVAGGDATSGAPASAAVVLSWTIARRYRGGHPRSYIGGLPVTVFINAHTIDPTKKASFGAAGVAWRAAIRSLGTMGNTWEMANVSYYHKVGGLQAYKDPPDVDVITGVKVHDRLDSQRRRLGKETS